MTTEMDLEQVFGMDVKKGNNHDVLRRAAAYFEDRHNVTIHRYYICENSSTRSKSYVDESFLQECATCDHDLYKIDEDESHVHTKPMLYSCRHLTFETVAGELYRTCYKFGNCLERDGWTGNAGHEPIEGYRAPSLEEFLMASISGQDGYVDDEQYVQKMKEENEDYWTAAVNDFESFCQPFMETWVNRPVNKNNLSEFMKELRDAEYQFINRYASDEQAASLMFKKLLSIVGVISPQDFMDSSHE